MGNKVQGRAETGGDVEEERVGGRGHVLPEGESKITYNNGRHKTELAKGRTMANRRLLTDANCVACFVNTILSILL